VVTSSAVSSAKRSKARTLGTFKTKNNNEKQPTETQNDNTFKDVFFEKMSEIAPPKTAGHSGRDQA
jgi:hypothetical protein